MNKLKTVGLSALAGSLAMVSANAVEYAVTGDAMVKIVSAEGNEDGATASNGKGIGVDNSMTFNMSGEMDNGWSVSAYTAMTDAHAFTTSAVTLTMGDMGKIMSGSGYGGNSANYDEETPRAYEQVDDGGGTADLLGDLLGGWRLA